jgi:hypothetical protein
VLQGKCNPKTTKGCKQKKEITQDVQQMSTQLSSQEVTRLEPQTNSLSIVTKNIDQDMKDYLDFLNFRKMKESASSINNLSTN